MELPEGLKWEHSSSDLDWDSVSVRLSNQMRLVFSAGDGLKGQAWLEITVPIVDESISIPVQNRDHMNLIIRAIIYPESLGVEKGAYP